MPVTYNAETLMLECHEELVVRIGKFSEMPASFPYRIDLRECINADLLFPKCFPRINVYANGYDSTTEGCVYVQFYNHHIIAQNLACVIAVIDAEGKRRFPQSFSDIRMFFNREVYSLYWSYISRRVLLNEPSELIPDDTLSLHIDLDILIETSDVRNMLDACIEMGLGRRTFVLALDSKLGKRLCQESKYFECLRTTPLMEGNSRNKIEENGIFGTKEHKGDSTEFVDFDAIHRILFCTLVKFHQMDEIFRLYRTADKYDIPLVVDFCRNCLELYLTPETAPEILEFAEYFYDDRLRETAEKFHAAHCILHSRHTARTETAFTVHSRATGMDYEWIFKRPYMCNEYGEWIGQTQCAEVFYKESHEWMDWIT